MAQPKRHSPLLQGALREEALRRLAELARELERPYETWALSQRPDDTGLRTTSLALGRCGLALFYAWLWKTGLDDRAGDLAARFLEEAIDLLPSQSMDASFLCGFPGVAWTAEHVLSVLDEIPDEDPNSGIDEALLA
ncbi:MAG: hypothetical protein KC729_12300, partial [Candidatus Eisenbacteria bacterium]|nr:hypothetical protein [Candidatus Eisenbacteria bacterium]